MSQMLEKCARAIFIEEHAPGGQEVDWLEFDVMQAYWLQSAKVCLTALLDLDEGTVEAMSKPDAVREVDAMIGSNAARNGYRLGWADRGEEPPLVQSFKAAIQHIINEGEGT